MFTELMDLLTDATGWIWLYSQAIRNLWSVILLGLIVLFVYKWFKSQGVSVVHELKK
jgi:hypothetical protein